VQSPEFKPQYNLKKRGREKERKKKGRKEKEARHQLLMPVILASQEAEIRRIAV
jgi:hypothetical protein